MRTEGARPDRRIAAIAADQHGVVSTAQLAENGVSGSSLGRRLRNGRLHRIHRGVYAVGHPGLSREGRWMAAVLACGLDAVLSHRSAAALWGLLPVSAGAIDVTIPGGGGRRSRHGIRRHRSDSLNASHVTRSRGIPVTTSDRTIADLRRLVAPAQLRQAIREAEVLGLETGIKRGQQPIRSELEHKFLALCRRHRLPKPEVNAPTGPFIADFLWTEERVIVETDGYRYHRGRQAFEDDRARELELAAFGFRLRRFSARQVSRHAREVAAAMRAELGVASLFP